MKTKTMPATINPDADEGVFEAIVSVFNNKDLVGDIVRPGAFRNSLEHWKSLGDPIPVYWSHRMDDPMFNIGEVIDAHEVGEKAGEVPEWANEWVRDNGGLYVKGKLDDFGMGAQVAHLMKTRRVKQFSFSYDVIAERRAKSGENELLDLWLHEVGPTPLGANPLTELISAKSNPDPPPEPDPDPVPEKKRRQPSALFLRHQADIARWQYELAD